MDTPPDKAPRAQPLPPWVGTARLFLWLAPVGIAFAGGFVIFSVDDWVAGIVGTYDWDWPALIVISLGGVLICGWLDSGLARRRVRSVGGRLGHVAVFFFVQCLFAVTILFGYCSLLNSYGW